MFSRPRVLRAARCWPLLSRREERLRSRRQTRPRKMRVDCTRSLLILQLDIGMSDTRQSTYRPRDTRSLCTCSCTDCNQQRTGPRNMKGGGFARTNHPTRKAGPDARFSEPVPWPLDRPTVRPSYPLAVVVLILPTARCQAESWPCHDPVRVLSASRLWPNASERALQIGRGKLPTNARKTRAR
jgi:hypothetical protein